MTLGKSSETELLQTPVMSERKAGHKLKHDKRGGKMQTTTPTEIGKVEQRTSSEVMSPLITQENNGVAFF